MRDVTAALTVATALFTGVSGLVAAAAWWSGRATRAAWLVLRGGQAVSAALAVAAGVRYAVGPAPREDLFYLYALLPAAVAFVAEQLRLTSAETVLEQRGIDGTGEVRALPEADQRSIVDQIMRRELGIVAVGALVAAFLAWRGWIVNV